MSSKNTTGDSRTGVEKGEVLSIAGKPLIAITMGDPAGIGPEVVLKALDRMAGASDCIPVVIGDFELLGQTAESCGIAFDFIRTGFEELQEGFRPQTRSICDLRNIRAGLETGKVSAEAGTASGEYIEAAVDLCKSGRLDALATALINKLSFNAGGYDFPGHTEFLAQLTNTKKFAMSFFADKLRVVLLSIHVSLTDAIGLVTRDRMADLIRFSALEFGRLLNKRVSIAVAGLNPHASEKGMFGSEEESEIIPAIRECRETYGVDVSGPYSPDTVFLRGYDGEFDAVIACYHDQATIAVKCLSFGKGVNVTIGLPIVRTSVDHGTAFEIAGKNAADSGSMEAAIKLATDLVLMRS